MAYRITRTNRHSFYFATEYFNFPKDQLFKKPSISTCSVFLEKVLEGRLSLCFILKACTGPLW